MTAFTIKWDEDGKRFYETGTDRGVLFPRNSSGSYGSGVPWNGLTAVTESPSGAEETALYADNRKYVSLRSAEEFGGTIEAYTYPDEWAACDGSATVATGVTVGQQTRSGFGLSYRTIVGNDEEGDDCGYKIHLVYGATASPSERSYASVNDSPEAITFSWEFTTNPIDVPGASKPSAILTIDTRKLSDEQIAAVETLIYGAGTSPAPTMPTPTAVIAVINGAGGVTGATGATTAQG